MLGHQFTAFRITVWASTRTRTAAKVYIAALAAYYDHAAFLAAISDDIACRIYNRFKIIVLSAGAIETFGTKSIAEFFGGDR